MEEKKAVVLLSGGMDSAVTLYIAQKEYGYKCSVLIFDYGQKANKEMDFASQIVKKTGTSHHKVNISMPWKGSSLIDALIEIPKSQIDDSGGIPSTYVPARNIIFLSYGVSFAEAIGAEAIFIGAHELDYSNYPDCRSIFFDAFQKTINVGTKQGVENDPVRIIAPIINMTKKQIVQKGIEHGVPFDLTWSCYEGGEKPCMECESCKFRMRAFEEAGIKDPLID